MTAAPVIMVVAAEASGDVLGGELITALKMRLPNVRFIGVGGERMTAAGLTSAFDISDLSILGIFEGVAAYGRIVRRVREVAELAASEKPDIAVLIDSWGFTVRIAKALRKLPNPPIIVKYVGPQVWASRPGRAKTLAGTVDHLLSILPFDAPFYEPHGLPVTFIGNPVLAREPAKADKAAFRKQIGAGAKDDILLVLPGSRPGELKRVLPVFEEALMTLKVARPNLHVVVPAASTVAEAVKARVAAWPFKASVVEGDTLKLAAMQTATLALACSGTVTTELGLAGCPMVVGYRISNASYAVLKPLIRTKYGVLLNIAAQRLVVPEFMQYAFKAPALAKAVTTLLDDPAARAAQVADQNESLKKMGRGNPDPSKIAADVIAGLVA